MFTIPPVTRRASFGQLSAFERDMIIGLQEVGISFPEIGNMVGRKASTGFVTTGAHSKGKNVVEVPVLIKELRTLKHHL